MKYYLFRSAESHQATSKQQQKYKQSSKYGSIRTKLNSSTALAMSCLAQIDDGKWAEIKRVKTHQQREKYRSYSIHLNYIQLNLFVQSFFFFFSIYIVMEQTHLGRIHSQRTQRHTNTKHTYTTNTLNCDEIR